MKEKGIDKEARTQQQAMWIKYTNNNDFDYINKYNELVTSKPTTSV